MSLDSPIESSHSFGNYLIHGIDEVILPSAISWWPSTIGWQLVALALVIYALRTIYKKAQHWWKNRYRREAIAKINELENDSATNILQVVEQLPFYLKAVALHAYPREQVAQLSGSRWIEFLNSAYSSEHFNPVLAEQLLKVSYQAKSQWQLTEDDCLRLIDTTKLWIKYHV